MNKNNDPITDDAELAKVLEGMQEPAASTPATPATSAAPAGIAFDDDDLNPAPYLQTPVPSGFADQTPPMPPEPPVAEVPLDAAPVAPPVPPAPEQPVSAYAPEQPASAYAPGIEPPTPVALSPVPSGNLEAIKKDALDNLRPLVDKLNLPADEKFDTLLLLIRSTDDQSLVTPAYDAARNISDETKRAQALLDIIKEIDYFSHPNDQPDPAK